ncbi:MAG: iron-sulfur cluster carrier protein ApbC [Gammaproteobacteria bacterium]
MLPLKNIKKIIAVASGKGGVGKSTVAVNLALALAKQGAAVGLLDADIYGPSQPTMLGLEGKRPEVSGRSIFPMKQYGIQSMSIGYLVDPAAAMMWRGPMIGKAMEQMLFDTQWENLDYLIVDLPPGTGDIQLSLCQKIPVNGAVVVTTPQDLALLDVRRACEMFNKLQVPILGVVENMSIYHCSHCGHDERIFGEGGGEKLAREFGLTELGAIPLAKSIREMSDHGKPLVVEAPDSDYAKAFYKIAEQVKQIIIEQPEPPKDYSAKFPKVVVQHKKEE